MSNVLSLPFGSRSKLPAREERAWVTSHELMADAEITFRQLDYWTRTGLLEPLTETVQPYGGRYPDRRVSPGSGHLRRYDQSQIRRAQAARALMALGMPRTTVLDVIDELLATGHADLGPIHLTYDPKEAS